MTNILPLFKVKRCSICRQDLALTEFHSNRNSRVTDQYEYRCKKCISKKNKTPKRRAQIKLQYRRYIKTIDGKSKWLLKDAKHRAAKNGLEFDLTMEWLQPRLAAGYCELSGIKFDFSGNRNARTNPYIPSIDRIDNRRGYTQDNCRIICWALNLAFADWGEDCVRKIMMAYLNKMNEPK